MEGRELKNAFRAFLDDLESNVRFMASLPPVQELIRPDDAEADTVWRDRLATIFIGLLGAKPAFTRVVFSKVEDGNFTELVRVERHSREQSKVRKVPRSRLRTGEANDYIRRILEYPPDEVLCAMVRDPLCELESACTQPRLVAGLPIYDEETEEPFGVLMIDCDVEAFFNEQMHRRWLADEIVVACDTHQVMMHYRDGQIRPESRGQGLDALCPHLQAAAAALQENQEYIDETDYEAWGARVWLVPGKHGLMYLLRQST